MITLENGVLRIETGTQIATMENGRFTSLVSKATGRNCVSASGEQVGLSLQWMDNDVRRLDTGEVSVRLQSENRAEFIFHSWYGDGVLSITCDPQTGDIVVTPNGTSGRMGVKAVRWEIAGVSDELWAVVPTYQGLRLKLDDPLIAGRTYAWPSTWEIGLCIFESQTGDGFWVHCRDTKYTYKDLSFGKDDQAGTVGLHTEAYGPLDNNRTAGGLAWRINCFTGGWRAPAGIYKQWYRKAYDADREAAKRRPWLKDIKMAVCGANDDTRFLDALAQKVDPKKVLIHEMRFRDFKYDQNYPDYTPSASGRKYFERGAELGFHIAPHLNSMDVDPSHPVYPMLTAYEMLHPTFKTTHGWGFDHEQWKFLGVPWTQFAKTDPRNRSYNIMARIHPASAIWQSILYEQVQKLTDTCPVDCCFVDVTLNTFNLHNCLCDGKTSTEGLHDLLLMLGEIGGGLPMGGEGLNEITALGLSFAQMHLYHSEHHSCPGLERTGGDCAINDFILGDLCFTVGYANLTGKDEDQLLRSKIHDDHNTIPTITVTDPEAILHPNKFVAELLEKANS